MSLVGAGRAVSVPPSRPCLVVGRRAVFVNSSSSCCLVSPLRAFLSWRRHVLSFRPSSRYGVAGGGPFAPVVSFVVSSVGPSWRSGFLSVLSGVSCDRLVGRLVFPVVFVCVVGLVLSVIAHRRRASSFRACRRYRVGRLVLRRCGSSLVSCSIPIRAVFVSSVSRRGVGCGLSRSSVGAWRGHLRSHASLFPASLSCVPSLSRIGVSPVGSPRLAVGRLVISLVSLWRPRLSVRIAFSITARAVFVSSITRRFLVWDCSGVGGGVFIRGTGDDNGPDMRRQERRSDGEKNESDSGR